MAKLLECVGRSFSGLLKFKQVSWYFSLRGSEGVMVEKIRLWLPVCLYCAAIFYLSSLQQLPEAAREFPDKLGHLLLYAGLGGLAARAFSRDLGLSRTGTWIGCALFCLAYGVTDEFHQSFVPGRSPEVGDILADFVGGFVGAYIYCILERRASRFATRAERP